jgi:hypothetical protein
VRIRLVVLLSAAEREEFLAGKHLGVLSTAVGTAGRTLAVSVWYSYQPGGPLTGRWSRKAARKDRPAIGSGILIARGDSSPRQNTSICARHQQLGGGLMVAYRSLRRIRR